jgi:ParB family chromosome partitioning protein
MARTKKPVRLEYVPIEYLDPNPFQPRQAIDQAELSDLVASIERFDFTSSLEARRNPADPARRLQLVFGHRRLAAAKVAGLRQLPIVIVERTDREMAEQAFIENRTHKQLSPWEEACFVRDYQQRHPCSFRGLAHALHVSKGFIQNRLDLFKIPERSPIWPPLRANAIDMTTAMTLHTLSQELPETEIAQLVGQVAAGALTNKDLQRLTGRVKPAASTDSPTTVTPLAGEPAAEFEDDAEGTVGTMPKLGPVGRFADLVLEEDMSQPSSLPQDQRVVPCGRDDDEERMASGMVQPDGTELENAPVGVRHAYLCLHELRQGCDRARQHVMGADWDSLSPMANDDLDDVLAGLEELIAAIRKAR